jgi:serralysin
VPAARAASSTAAVPPAFDPGLDAISGGDEDDFTTGGDGDDMVRGHAGDDRITGGDGRDLIEGGSGAPDGTGSPRTVATRSRGTASGSATRGGGARLAVACTG